MEFVLFGAVFEGIGDCTAFVDCGAY